MFHLFLIGMAIPLITAQIEIIDLNHGNGYSLLKLDKVKLIERYDRITYLINTTMYKQQVDNLEALVRKEIEPNPLMMAKIKHIRTQIDTLTPHNRIQKRGLFNFMGTGLKYIYGTMDDEDRQEIEGKLEVNTVNAHNAIEQINLQKNINEKFNHEIKTITANLNHHNKELFQNINEVNTELNKLSKEKWTNKLLENLMYIETNIMRIKEILMTSQNNLLSRHIITDDDSLNFNMI